jgi:putative ABC transport system permease protein
VLKTTIKGLLARKFRLVTTALAVLLGVAFMVGTLVFTDTISKTFDELFATVSAGTDAQVRSKSVIDVGDGTEIRNKLDAEILDVVDGVDGVAVAEGVVQVRGPVIVGSDGDAVRNPAGAAPQFGRNWLEDDRLNPFDIEEGREPRADGEVVIDRFTADRGDLSVDDRTFVTNLGEQGNLDVQVVGIATFGDTDSPGGSTNVMLTTAAAQREFGEQGLFDAISVRANGGITEDAIRDRIARQMPRDVEVLTGAEKTKEDQDDFAQGLGFFRTFLVAFAVIALFVGIFIIYNTFNILVAQRVREMALLRAVGASRRQVLGSVVLEAAVVGLVAGALGVVAGVGIAAGLRVLFNVIGLELPSGSLVVTVNTVVLAFVVGLVVSVLSALVPAMRASRVPPVAAMRDVAVDRPHSVVRVVAGAVVTALSALLILNGLFGNVDNPLLVVGVGALGLVIGIAVLGPLFAGPVSRLIGAPVSRIRGVSGRLARLNAARNPSRTSTTAAALMIGVTLVAFITVVAASFKASFEDTLAGAIKGDFVVDSGTFEPGTGLPPRLADELRTVPEVDLVGSVRFLAMEIEGKGTAVGAITPEAAGPLFDVGLVDGSYADLDATGIAVFEDKADDLGLHIGDPVPVRFVETGAQELTVRAVFEDDDLVGDWFVGQAVAEANTGQQFDFQDIVQLAPGVTVQQARPALERVVDRYPTADLFDQQEYRAAQTQPIDQILGLVYALLSFSVIIALIGIANTLALSVLERTRELGLLRAVGMTRPQMRSMVRWESVIIALLGTLLGIALGSFFGWATVTAASDEGLAVLRIPVPQLVIVAVIAALAGVWAARRPAKRAAKLDVLQAIATT